MVRGKPIAQELRLRMVGAYENGATEAELVQKYELPKQSVNNLVKKWKITKTTEISERSGRPRVTTRRMDRLIKLTSLRSRFSSPRDIEKSVQANCSPRTVARRLDQVGLRARCARRKPLLSARNIKRRLQYASEYLDHNWDNVLFTDEKKWKLHGSDGKTLVRRRDGEAFNKECVIPTVKHGGGSVMTWGCFSRNGPGMIVLVAEKSSFKKEDYLLILQNGVIPSLLALDCDTLLHDNDPKHTAKINTKFLNESHEELVEFGKNGVIKVIPHPPQSPDLNPIEHLWAEVERKVQERRPTNKSELFQFIQEEWYSLSKETCAKYVDSMKNRLVCLKKAKGFCIDY